MSDTPITDATTFNVPCHGADGTGSRVAVVPYQICRDIERQLAEKTDAIQDAANLIDEWRNRARRDRDKSVEWEEKHNALERQLAEAREELANWKDAAASAENPHPDEVHCTCVPLLRGALAEVTKQRDELAARIGWESALATLKGDKP